MKFSILLPTRDRLDLLKLAIESVRVQDHADWEIAVSDNASEADVVGYVRSLGDERVKARRFDQSVPVTENWNASLENARGDYTIMLGDDDALMPGALSALATLIEAWQGPDAIYAQAEQYAYAGVIPDHPEPLLQVGYNEFLNGKHEAFRVPREIALRMVRSAMAFRIRYGFNMQHFALSRGLIERLSVKGPLFQSPYPDYYAANAVMLAARTIVATPEPMAMIGISAKSFGYFYFNKREAEGVEFLRHMVDPDVAAQVRRELVPGNNMNDSWLYAMQTLARNFAAELDAPVRYARYRRLQYHELLKSRKYRELIAHMRWWEFLLYGGAALAFVGAGVLPKKACGRTRSWIIESLFSVAPRFDLNRRAVPYRNILEAARAERREYGLTR